MKNIVKLTTGFIFCFLMIYKVDALVVNQAGAMQTATNYLEYEKYGYDDTYQRYIYRMTTKLNSFYKGVTPITLDKDLPCKNMFECGGLLSYEEFEITKNGKEKNEISYLYSPVEYWTYTKNGTQGYIVSSEKGKKEHASNYKSGIRVTEIVKPEVTVIGDGTYSDPWIFEPQYNVTFYVNKDASGKYKGKIGLTTNEADALNKLTKTMSSNEPSIYIFPDSEYEYLGNTCGVIINDIDVRNRVSNELKISSVTRDIECTINFGEKPYTVNLVPTTEEYKEMTEVDPTQVYVVINKKWYDEPTSTNAISKIKKGPSLEGYTFEGYYDTSNYKSDKFQLTCSGNQIIDKNLNLASPKLTKTVSGKTVSVYSDNMQAYPCFKPIEYKINYDCGEGTLKSGAIKQSTHTYNIEGTLLKSGDVCTKTGYTFAGWARDKNGTTADRFLDGVAYQKITSKAEEITLYAQWTPNTYQITYYLGNGTTTAGTKKIGTKNCVYDSDCTLDKFTTINSGSYPFPYSEEYEASNPNKNYGWSFYGWTTNKTEKPNAENKININYTDNKTFKYTTAGNINLYAIGKRNINFNGDVNPTKPYANPLQYWNPYQANNTYLTSIVIPNSTAIETWTFVGYKCCSNEANTNNVTYAKIGTTQKVPYNTNPNMRSLYKRTLTVAYDANEGKGTTSSHTATQYYNTGYALDNLNYGATTSTVEFTLKKSGFTRTAYKFTNWLEGSPNGVGYNAQTKYTFPSAAGNKTTSKTMFAKWTPVEYAITYNLNGGTIPNNSIVSYNIETATFNLPTPSKNGYDFGGWYTAKALTGSPVTQITEGSTGAKTFYAKWTPTTYTITYVLNSGTNPSGAKSNYNIETATFNLPTPSRTGYKFDGWYKEAAFTNKVTQVTKGSTGNKTFYAKWIIENYTISYTLNGGTNPTGAKTSYNITTATYTLPTPTKSGSTFLGWYTESSYTNKVTQIAKGSTGNKTFYAKWQDPTSLPDFKYTGKYELVEDNDTVIASGTNNRVTIPASHQNFQGNWKLRLLSDGELTFYNMANGTNVDIFLVGGGAPGTKGYSEGCSSGTCYCGGGGGKGGTCKTQSDVSLSLNTAYTTKIGGSNAASSIAINGTTYSAAGGGGANGASSWCNGSGGGSSGKAGCYEFGSSSYKRYAGGGGSGGNVYSYHGGTWGGGSGGANGGGTGGSTSWYSGHGSSGGNGKANTGGGGGGGGMEKSSKLSAGKGGSGIVIIRNKR